jgi:hypothetical protein
LKSLIELLEHSNESVRISTLLLLGNAVSNNPKAQENVMEKYPKIVQNLFEKFKNEPNDLVKKKIVYFQNNLTRNQFLKDHLEYINLFESCETCQPSIVNFLQDVMDTAEHSDKQILNEFLQSKGVNVI